MRTDVLLSQVFYAFGGQLAPTPEDIPKPWQTRDAWTIFGIDLKMGTFPTLSTDVFSSHLYQFMLTTVKKPLEKLYLL